MIGTAPQPLPPPLASITLAPCFGRAYNAVTASRGAATLRARAVISPGQAEQPFAGTEQLPEGAPWPCESQVLLRWR
jgi:hypothetical protein